MKRTPILLALFNANLGDVCLIEAVRFANRHTETPEDFKSLVVSIASRCDRGGLSLTEFEEKFLAAAA